MKTDSEVVSFPHPDTLDDPLTSVLRERARRLLAQAVEVEAKTFLAVMTRRLPIRKEGNREERRNTMTREILAAALALICLCLTYAMAQAIHFFERRST
ncbi:hypothetical protein AA309_29620 [Microvirga vignae]|uniref:Uncharacterized protein n=1 Tax=Microvirga vignae TaxID=1225564 RepID=A0A0H1R3F3_9HYPH|nr:hypothetical protein AA309_29620 [Microvirga vignae]